MSKQHHDLGYQKSLRRHPHVNKRAADATLCDHLAARLVERGLAPRIVLAGWNPGQNKHTKHDN